MAKKELFTSRFGLLAAAIGMAIGAGNIWRFPRLAGQYGGAFLIPWLLFLFIWSLPLMVGEFAIGKRIKQGTIGAFVQVMGKQYAWMGLFVGFCTTAILFYYSVVTGWSLKYFFMAISGNLFHIEHAAFWDQYTSSVYQPLLYHLFSVGLGAFVIYRGIAGGVERFSKIIVPALFILLVIAAVKALTLPGAEAGISYFFSIDVRQFGNYKLWLDALSQSAWSTGAGWGLLLTYAIYTRSDEPVLGNSLIAGVGNNLASIIAGLAIVPTLFALSTPQAARQALAAGNQGLAFITIPQLFEQMSGGIVFAAVFFLALFFAALSSLISMIELAARILMDFGLTRRRAVLWVGLVSAVAGAPAAISLAYFNNQDWVWGLGLILSGLFFMLAVIKIGARQFITVWAGIKHAQKFYITLYRILFYALIPLEFVLMMAWWLIQSLSWYPQTWWNPFETFSMGTAVGQWLLVIILAIIFNRIIVKKLNSTWQN